MGEESTTSSGAIPWRVVRQQAAYLALIVTSVAVAALIMAAVTAGFQAGRDEARSADLAFVVVPIVPPAVLADHAFELYRRGYVVQLVLAGEGREGLKAELVARGVPQAQVALSEADVPVLATLQHSARQLRVSGGSSLLIVTTPEEILTALKLVRDQGLRAYGAPVPGTAPDVLRLLLASVHYWQYVLGGV